MEAHKTEAVRRMQQRIPGRSMRSIVETEIVAMDTNIREFYDKELPYSAIDLAWMVTKDSCFLFGFMLNFSRFRTGQKDFYNECVVKGRYDGVLSSSVKDPIWSKLSYDLALFENQIPLTVLQRLLAITYTQRDPEKILGDILNEAGYSSNFGVFQVRVLGPYNKQMTLHFLEFFYNKHVGWKACSVTSVKDQRLLHLGWTNSIFTRCCPRWMRHRGVEDRQLLHFGWISSIFTRCCPSWMSSRGHPSNADVEDPFFLKLPSAAELKKKGVNFYPLTLANRSDEPGGVIRWVQFDNKTSTLYLPEMHVDLSRQALLRNFIALEIISAKYNPSPITSFAYFMDELVDSEEDVAVLREANVIKNFFGSNQEAAQCFNTLTRKHHRVAYYCTPIDNARVGLHKYLRRANKTLWNEFISTYFAKPWLDAGSVAGTLIVAMTMLQVFCLFYTSNRNSQVVT